MSMFTCEVCGEKPAKIHVTQIKNNKKVTVHMCQDCANKQSQAAGGLSMPLGGVLASFLNQESAAHAVPSPEELTTCPQCGQTNKAFKESGRLACEQCYETFASSLEPLIAKVQKGTHHTGKRPIRGVVMTQEENLASLRRQLKDAVEKEEFEKAASLRDEIKKLQSQKDL